MLIRIRQRSGGIERYLEKGHKQGRVGTRDEIDHRIHIGGDLNAFSLAVHYTQQNKPRWDNHYWHITASFTADDSSIDANTIRMIHQDMMDYYFCGYDRENVIHACEAHFPRQQSELNKATGALDQRLKHIHLAVSKYDQVTGNQLRMTPYNEAADRAFQSYLCQKYGLVDPVDRKREVPITKRDIIARWKGDLDTSKQTKVANLRKLFSQLVNDAPTLDAATDILMETGLVKDVTLKDNQKSGNRYLQVQTTEGTRNINLRGKGFEQLEKLYYDSAELDARALAGKYKEEPKKSIEENKEIWEKHQQWWLGELAKRAPKRKVKIDHEKTQKKYESYYKKYSREQRRYFVIYRNNIQEESIRGYRIWEKANERYLVNSDLGVKIYDRPDRITLEIPDDPEKRSQAVKLALSIAMDKGWNLDTLEVTGSAEFIEEAERQIAELKAARTDAVASPKPIPELQPEPQPKLNAVSQALDDFKEEKTKRLSKEKIAELKSKLDAHVVIEYAREHYGLLSEHFTVTNSNKIDDERTKAKPRNVVDFLTKTCNISISDALPILQELYQQQLKVEAAPDMDISICTSSNSNGLGGWVHKQPKTFTELAGLVKSHNYAAFVELTDNYRKANNVVQLGNCAIFDIDNDPDQPNLSIAEAQELLKGTTYMLVTSKSHQIDKMKPSGEPLPAADRYRVIVPLTQPLTASKDQYRLEMMKIAEQLGLAEYADPKALKDISRQYYRSPTDAQVIVNNTKQAVDTAPIIEWARDEQQRMEEAKAEAATKVWGRYIGERREYHAEQAEYPKVVDLDAINQLPLPEIYEMVTGRSLEEEGSYLMGKGITQGTSGSRNSFTVFQSGDHWLWHDFKSGESGNVVSFMAAVGQNVFEAAEMLAERFDVELMTDNPGYYEKVLERALETANNDKELEELIRAETGARFVRLGKHSIEIADKKFDLADLGYSKLSVINQMKENRGVDTGPSLKP